MTTLLLLSGSQRRDSLNTRLLRHLGQHFAGRCVVDLIESHQIDLPLFDQDMETIPAVIDRVVDLHRRFKASHGIVVACPEYNGQVTPYLKNIIDWVSRLANVDNHFDNAFYERPLLLCSASTGWSGGALAVSNARALFSYVGCLVLGDVICIPYADQALTENGYLFDPFMDAQIEVSAGRVLKLAQKLADARSFQHKAG
ncbi:NAD(P)H-dependent oxidoreductase [Escherichia coli]|nr:NAD(P)H-dependent oxidoreductase [Escherichia coli]